MKEIKSLVERAKKYLKSAGMLLKEEDYESSVSRTLLCYVLFCTSYVAYKEPIVFIS